MAENNLHGGHRQRLKNRFLRDGADGFEKHQLLELLLFYAIPQRDTNPLAHKLLEQFGSLSAVFNASIEELCTVDGISTHTATLIKLIPAIYGVSAGEVDNSKRYDSVNKVGELLVRRYSGLTKETVLLVLFDNTWHIIDIVNLGTGSVNQVPIDTRILLEAAIRKNASMALLAHNHPNGDLIPSSEDLVTTEEVARLFEKIHVKFLEHLLIAGNRFEPLLSRASGVFSDRIKKTPFYD